MVKTKIVATIGPSTWEPKVLEDMYKYGFRIARINSSFADLQECKKDKKLMRDISEDIALMMDTQGPKIRVKGLSDEINLKEGQTFTVTSDISREDIPHVTHENMHKDVEVGTRILLDDGNIQAEVQEIEGRDIDLKILNAGKLINGKTVNVPNTQLNIPLLTEKDKENIQNAVDLDFDFVATSFVQTAEDIQKIRDLIGSSKIQIIAKIETQRAVENFDEILEAADGVMVARGDLGVELPLEQVPMLQKEFIKKCKTHNKPVIVATQMLETMKELPRPTRAEVSDVANAILDGTDCVMLSAETSIGKYPEKAVKTMFYIAREIEDRVRGVSKFEYKVPEDLKRPNYIAEKAIKLTEELNSNEIIVFTESGFTARVLSSFLPKKKIIAITQSKTVIRQLSMVRGITALSVDSGKAIPGDRDDFVSFIVKTLEANDIETNKESVILKISDKSKRSKGFIEIVSL